MSSDDFPTPGWEERFPEPLKFLPVAFIVAMIVGLYSIYVTFHLKPRMEDPGTSGSAYFDAFIFHLVTFMLVFCYVLCVFVHPGTIPDKEEDPSWEYDEAEGPQPIAADLLLNMQEMKRSGDRRHCKWCLKYKPDRCHHCRVCRICILKMDHHCPWIYNCVGFRNYKYFFLLLLYTSIDCAFIVFSMIPSVRAGTQPTTPFMTMFWLMFGETLAGFLGVLVFLFFCFHIYLMMKAMTTIEFCEKSHSKGSFNASTYDRGVVGNVKAVLGDDWWLWLLPTSRPPGRGVSFISEETRLSKDMEAGRGLRRRAHDRPEGPSGTTASAPKRRSDAKPAACGGTGSTGQSEEDSHSGSGSEVPDVGSSRDPRQVPNYGAADVGSPKTMEAAEK